MARLDLTMSMDTAQAQATIEELHQAMKGAPDAFLDRFSAIPGGVNDLFDIEDHGTPKTNPGHIAMVIRPTELLSRVIATAESGEFDLSVFDTKEGVA